MRVLQLDYNMNLEFSSDVIDHQFILRCVPVSRGCQTVISSNLQINPFTNIKTCTDVFGNVSYRGFIKQNHNEFGFSTNATVLVHGIQGTREKCLPLYKYPSSLTVVNDSMIQFLYDCFEGSLLLTNIKNKSLTKSQIIPFAVQLCHEIHNYITYTPGSTNVRTTASQAFDQKKGVCQDYAHIFCALCRYAGVAARYICGASVGEGCTHAWAEFFVPDENLNKAMKYEVSGRWFGLDPTRDKRCSSEYIILALGRDYNDCQVDRGIFRGAADQTQTVFVKTSEVNIPEETNYKYTKLPIVKNKSDDQ